MPPKEYLDRIGITEEEYVDLDAYYEKLARDRALERLLLATLNADIIVDLDGR